MKDRSDAILQPAQASYLDSLLTPRDALLARMEALASAENQPIADPEVAQFLRVLVRLLKPRRVLEIGTNIGYSVIVIGRECGPQAIIESIEIDRDTLEKARSFVQEARLDCGVVFHEGAALDVLPRLTGPYDLLFIDCVKTEYDAYLDAALPLLTPGAAIVCDNLLWKGKVASGENDPSTAALRQFNQRLVSDPRLITTILPLGDGTGLSIVR